MSYLNFLLIFVVLPALILVAIASRRASRSGQLKRLRWHWIGTAILTVIAFVWTTPWDNYIVANGVWSYGEGRVIGVIGYVPIEEYLFFVLMPVLNSAFFALLLLIPLERPVSTKSKQTSARIICSVLSLAVVSTSVWLLPQERFTYLATTLAWFVPALWIQWIFDPVYLRRMIMVLAITTLVPTLYFSLADTWAINEGIWTIHEATRTGWEIGSLPFEEAFFFFITSLLLSQGLILWHSLRPE